MACVCSLVPKSPLEIVSPNFLQNVQPGSTNGTQSDTAPLSVTTGLDQGETYNTRLGMSCEKLLDFLNVNVSNKEIFKLSRK